MEKVERGSTRRSQIERKQNVAQTEKYRFLKVAERKKVEDTG